MAPTRRSKSVNKRVAYTSEVASKKKAENADRSGKRKRKLSDMLGPQWSKEELERFYEAYRKYGKDWKKAYLSLPEGTASVVGLIAMMTDHYGILAGSDGEQESDEATGSSQKSQKCAGGKFQNPPPKGSDGPSPDLLNFQSAAPNYGCLSLLKKRRSGSRPRAVAKRTPRVPVSYSYDKDNTEKYISPIKQGLKPRLGTIDDDVAHEIALALTEASQRGGSLLVSQTPKRKRGKPSPVQKGSRTCDVSEMNSSKPHGSEMDEDGRELSLGSTDADNGYYSRDKIYLMDAETADTIEIQQKGKRYHSKKLKQEESVSNHLDDIKEACSGTEEGQDMVVTKGKFAMEIADEKNSTSYSKGSKKRSKKVLFKRDESSEFDALQTLADLSLMMPETTADTELSLQLKEEKPEAVNESKLKGNRSSTGVKDTAIKTSKLGKDCTDDVSVIPESEEGNHLTNSGNRTKRQKFLPIKLRMDATEELKKFISKGKRSLSASQSKHGKLVKPPEHTSSTDHEKEGNNSASSTALVRTANQVNLPTKVRSRRKMNRRKLLIERDKMSSEDILNDHNRTNSSFFDRAIKQKEQLSNCLSWYQVRVWCVCEWFYSTIDYPWFAKREFVEYLDHVGLSHVPRLTRVEWGVIRSSLGRPRRFSEQFLKEEKEKLNQYRESVRNHYSELRSGTKEGLPTDLARPLYVGQRIIAVHPRTREICDGSVLTVEHSRYRVQFDKRELGIEFVQDIDCMPLNPLENMPASLTRPNVAFGKFMDNFTELQMNGQPRERDIEGYMKFTPCENLETAYAPSHISPSTNYPINNLLQQHKGVSYTDSEVHVGSTGQAKEEDVLALSHLRHALDKKEAIVSELRCMNDEILENQKDGDNSFKDSELFKKHYAAILLQLNDINEQVASALFCLRQRNTYQGNTCLTGLKPMSGLGNLGGGLPNSFDHSAYQTPESGPHVVEVVESSRSKAQKMVDVAVQALSSLEKEGNGIERIEEAMDYVNNKLAGNDSGMPSIRSSTSADLVHSSRNSQDQQLETHTTNLLANSRAPDSTLNNSSDENSAHIPLELIAHCVAALFMIQRCTERDFPPADVALVLDSAVTSLQPCCSQNLPVYAEIQKCMGIIRNQILALIPTST
ncbi:protein ALWAYS EARLY 3 isoform X2 [Citrus sinensis]|uniref:protein ALWAYS EARLY 3 isoform X2 n=1 Tax=Citrus sinensis TaxID=2711 RepID=UPI0003D72D20|nr:protein ALWAYS EARLY 3 isoform X2 [Citrus sinensis]